MTDVRPGDGGPGLAVLAADLGPGVRAFFTTRRGGVSRPPYAGANLGAGVGDDPAAVAANRAAVARVAGAPVTWPRPVHAADVALVLPDGEARLVHPAGGSPSPGSAAAGAADLHDGERDLWLDPAAPPVDVLVTSSPGRGLAALAADCVPVLLAGYDAAGHAVAVAAAHAGRRGVVAGAAPAAARALEAAGAVRVRAVVGPAVCGACYEVPAELQEEVCAVEPGARATTRAGAPALDLPGAVVRQLLSAGVEVSRLALCTLETPWLFSHRGGAPTGRFAGVVALRHATPWDIPQRPPAAR
ncbi:laccase domain-containing protein [Miniimonas sp. S16]|uniref:laccase domain-containing protein n=1 Tax=Miniimonas sp. S16 TaxID=2171623 RepID=UPI001F19F30A|nr:laccase domain-containing protein [Miniimonas sp. S16]